MTNVAERTDRGHYETDLEQTLSLDAPSWLKDIREGAAARFADLDFPDYKQEAWRYTDVKPIVQTPFRSTGTKSVTVAPESIAPYFYDEAGWTQLVFVDGRYSSDLSRIGELPSGIRAGSLAEAIANDEEIVRERLDQYAEATNAFVALNAGLAQDGAFVFIPDGVAHETPIHFVFVTTGMDNAASHPRNLVVLGESAEATMLETYVGLNGDAKTLTNVVSEVLLGDNAHLHRHKIVLEGDAAYHLSTAKVVQGRDSKINSFSITLSGQIVRNELDVVLNGEGANAILNGLYLNDRGRLIDNALHVTHASPKCYSRMGYKGVLDGSSAAVFTGKVLVPQDSQQTDSDQLNNNLLLSGDATIDTKPQLEIFADDVKCTHGATIGGFPSELIFYFQSRGMAADMAHAILTYGFAAEVVDEIGVGPLHDRLAKYVFDKYSPK